MGIDTNWREAYRARAEYQSAAIAQENNKAKARSAQKSSADLANAAFRTSIRNGATTLNHSDNADDELDLRIKEGGWDGFVASSEKALQSPVAQGVLDALSIGTYTSAAIANSVAESARAAKDNPNNPIGAFLGEGIDQTLNHNPVVMGVKAAFGDDDSTRTYADVIKNVQSISGADTENDAAKWAQGLGGFAGDVLLDPTTYLTLGAAPAIKGAVKGLREGGKAAKEVASKAVADAERAGGSLAGSEIARIAENTKGRIGTAIEGGKVSYADWKAAEATRKADKKAMRAERANPVGTLDSEAAIVGNDIKDFQAGIDSRQAVKDAELHAQTVAETERKAAESQARIEAEMERLAKPAETHLAEAVAHVKNEDIKPEIPKAATEETVAVPKPVTKEELNKTTIKEEVDAGLGPAPIVPPKPKPAEAVVNAINKPVFDKFDGIFQTQKYNNPKLQKAMAEPAIISRQVEKTDWDSVYKEIADNPTKMVKVTQADGTVKSMRGSSIVKNVTENGVNPTDLLPTLGLDAARLKPHTSNMRKVPRAPEERVNGIMVRNAPARKKGTSEFTGRTADKKQLRKEQLERGKTRVKKDDMGPQQVDYAENTGLVFKGEDGKLDYNEDAILTAKKIADPESDFDLEAFKEYVGAHPDELLHIRDVKTGVTGSISLDAFFTKLEAHIWEGANATAVDKYLRANPLFFAKFDESIDAADLAADTAAYEKAMADYTTAKSAPKAEEVVADTQAEVKDSLDEILDPEYDLVPNIEEAPNPNAWSPERAAEHGIDADHAHLSPQELALLTKPMNATQIKRYITSTNERGITKGHLDELRKFTGKTDPAEVADEFIRLRKIHQAGIKKEARAANVKEKAVRPTREQEVNKLINEEVSPLPTKATPQEIEAIQVENAKVAQEIADSPVALDEIAQKSFRLNDYEEAIKKPIDPALSGVLTKEHANDAARQAVKASIEFQTKEGKFVTDTGYLTHTEDIATGNAWRPDRWGSDSQIALHSSIWNYINKLRPAEGTKGWTPYIRARAYMEILEVADKELRAMGIEPFLNHASAGVGKAGVSHAANLSYYDILKALDRQGFSKHLNMLIDGKRSFIPTQVQGAAEMIIRLRASGIDEEVIKRKAVQQLIGGKVRGAKPGESVYRTEVHGRPDTNAEKADQFTKGRVNAIANGSPKYPGKGQMEAVRIRVNDAKAIADALMDPSTYRALNTQMMVNHAAHASALGKNVDDLVSKTVETATKLADSGSVGDVLGYLRAQLKDVSKKFSEADVETAKGLFGVRMKEYMSEAEKHSLITATKRADDIRPPAAVVEKQMAEQAEIIPSGKNVGKPASSLFVHDQPSLPPKQNLVNKSHAKEVESAEAEVRTMAPEGTEEFEIIGASIAAAAMKKIHPLQKFVNPRLGLTDNVYRAINSGLHSVARQQSEFHGSLLTHLAKHGDKALMDDFDALQKAAKEHGAISDKNPFMLPLDAPESMKELYGIIGVMFDKSAYNVFARNGIGANHFNSLADANGLHKDWRFQGSADAVTNSALWTTWEGIGDKGVLDFLSRMHSISIKASQDIAIGASFSKNFGKAAPEAGHVKITWNNRKNMDSVFYDLIDKDLYYPKDIAMQVSKIDDLLRESRHIDPKGPLSKFIVNVFDPVTNALKASQTTVRPGHWTVSIIGDLLRNQIAGVNTFMPYKHAAKIMLAGKKILEGEGDDFLNKIATAKDLKKYGISQEVNRGYVGSSSGSGVTLFVGGKKVNVNYETMHKLVNDVVQLPKHRGGGVLEDRFIENNPTSKFAKGLEKGTDFVTDNSKFSLNEWAARRDNLMRISLAVDYASKRKWKNLQDMKNGMEEYVTKWAPTSTDFTAFESKYARRSMLYYTWLRGITPRIIDSAMTKPGVTTMVPKALYNMAYANGLNPESIGNPFPDDMLVPSYYGNNVLGPQWKDDFGTWGINPSSPVLEVGNTFAKFKPGDPVGNVGGALTQLGSMATPFVRMPAELATGHQAGTGMPITDQGQYIADNLGGSYLSSLSRATGKTIGLNGIVDRTDSAARDIPGDQSEHAKLQLFNFLSGLKLTDYQSNAAVKSGAYDLAQKYKDQSDMYLRKQ